MVNYFFKKKIKKIFKLLEPITTEITEEDYYFIIIIIIFDPSSSLSHWRFIICFWKFCLLEIFC